MAHPRNSYLLSRPEGIPLPITPQITAGGGKGGRIKIKGHLLFMKHC